MIFLMRAYVSAIHCLHCRMASTRKTYDGELVSASGTKGVEDDKRKGRDGLTREFLDRLVIFGGIVCLCVLDALCWWMAIIQ